MKTIKLSFGIDRLKRMKMFLTSLIFSILYGFFLLEGYLPDREKLVIGDFLPFIPTEFVVGKFSPILEISAFFILIYLAIFSIVRLIRIEEGTYRKYKEWEEEESAENLAGILIAGLLIIFVTSLLPDMSFSLIFFCIFLLFFGFMSKIYIFAIYIISIALMLGFYTGGMAMFFICGAVIFLLFKPIPIAQIISIIAFCLISCLFFVLIFLLF